MPTGKEISHKASSRCGDELDKRDKLKSLHTYTLCIAVVLKEGNFSFISSFDKKSNQTSKFEVKFCEFLRTDFKMRQVNCTVHPV